MFLNIASLRLNFEPHLHVGLENKCSRGEPVKEIVGTGVEWTEVIEGELRVNAVPGRTTLRVSGPNALYVRGKSEVG